MNDEEQFYRALEKHGDRFDRASMAKLKLELGWPSDRLRNAFESLRAMKAGVFPVFKDSGILVAVDRLRVVGRSYLS